MGLSLKKKKRELDEAFAEEYLIPLHNALYEAFYHPFYEYKQLTPKDLVVNLSQVNLSQVDELFDDLNFVAALYQSLYQFHQQHPEYNLLNSFGEQENYVALNQFGLRFNAEYSFIEALGIEPQG